MLQKQKYFRLYGLFFFSVVVIFSKGTIRWKSPVLTGLWNSPGLEWGWSNLLLQSSFHSNSCDCLVRNIHVVLVEALKYSQGNLLLKELRWFPSA